MKWFAHFFEGMKQRLAIADILVKQPKVAFLDEPTTGIDPEGIVQILDLISKIAQDNKMTIIMSSHQLSQVQLYLQPYRYHVERQADSGRLHRTAQ